MQDCERGFEQLSDDQVLSKLCSDAGLKIVEKGQYFLTHDTEEGNEMQHLCQEYTMPRNEKKTRAKGWIFKNTTIGPVLDIKTCRHEDRYSVEVLVESLFQDRTASWVRIEKRFRYCLNPSSSSHFLYLRAIQGSGDNALDPELQDNVSYQKDLLSTSTTSGMQVK